MANAEEMFRPLKITDKVVPDEPLHVGLILQAMAEYQMIPMPTPAIQQLISAYQKPLLNPVWVKEQEAAASHQQEQMAHIQQGFLTTMGQQFGTPPSADDLLNPPD